MSNGQAILYLEDGAVFAGQSAGAPGETVGEVVFNTSMTGYLEVLTDPSYHGQLVAMTYPLQGNYGVNPADVESRRPWAAGFIAREICDEPSNWQSRKSLREYLIENGIVAISGIDTRALTSRIRRFGSMLGVISSECFDADTLKRRIQDYGKTRRNFVAEVAASEPYTVGDGDIHVAVLDLGIKGSILANLVSRGVRATVLPWNATAGQITDFRPDGLFLSNGPGDPASLTGTVDTVKSLIGRLPICGICLGHQIIGLALGMETYKLKFGHHGGNHPVKDLAHDRVFITSQNHNYALKVGDIPDVEITHVSMNDRTVEGLRHLRHPIVSVQYHPEAAPGPMDSGYIFDQFIGMIRQNVMPSC